MQLLIILALILLSGRGNAGNILSEVKPVLEEFGGEEVKQALKSAEELTSVISAVREMSSPAQSEDSGFTEQPVAFPLSPISAIADRDITYSLSRYIAQSA